ncbi:MAG TPA: chorismate mutase [Stellaceae bacterium]|nr:chorismate mutase [Stellaceae bacterium]
MTPPPDPAALEALRHRIDEIDDQIQDLLIRRAEVVEGVDRVKRAGNLAALRPGREAQILRRLVARHRGRFPHRILLRIWREILSGTIAMQTDFAAAVLVSEERPGFWDLARDHYGSHTPMLTYRASGEVIGAVAEGRAAVGVLPLPQEGDRDLWWRYLTVSDRMKPRVIARLPFAGAGNARGNGGNALVISLVDPEPSGEDCGLLALDTNADLSRGRLVAALKGAGFAVTPLAMVSGEGWDSHLFEIDNLLSVEDPRLATVLKSLGDTPPRVSLLGFYARPFAPAALDGDAQK